MKLLIILALHIISAVTFCNYLKRPPVCRDFNSTEIQKTNCNFNGPKIYRQLQCNYYRCAWNNKGTCTPVTKRPSKPPAPHYECYDLCLPKIKNGVCDDGGNGSVTSWCMYGTDCSDCGKRFIE